MISLGAGPANRGAARFFRRRMTTFPVGSTPYGALVEPYCLVMEVACTAVIEGLNNIAVVAV